MIRKLLRRLKGEGEEGTTYWPVAPPERPAPREGQRVQTPGDGIQPERGTPEAGWPVPQPEVNPPEEEGDPEGTEDPREDPMERVLPMEVQADAEEAVGEGLGVPKEAWRCPCGARPFVTESVCPNCGRKQAERWS